MSLAPIYFQFIDKKSALLAVDTLQEIGFRAGMLEQRHPEHKPTIHVMVDHADLTSALEVAQAHGGELRESAGLEEPEMYTSAYSLDQVPRLSRTGDDEEEQRFDPSGDDFGYFDAGVHM